MKKTHLLLASLIALTTWFACQNPGENKAASNGWVVVDNHGNITLLGKPVKDLESFQFSLYDTLSKMQKLPDSIPVSFGDELLMGMRGEIRTSIDEAIARAKARIACEATIHGFYSWYDAFQQDTIRNINFIDYKGKYLKLDKEQLDQYLKAIKSSGFVSDVFINGYLEELRIIAENWQKAPYEDGPPDGMDYDRFFCGQDWLLDSWTKSPVTVELHGERAVAFLKGMEGEYPFERSFELVNENGSWLLARIPCGED